MNNTVNTLLGSELFNGISEKELIRLLDTNNYKENNYKKGEILAQQHEVCNRLIILIKGSVRAEMINDGGKVIKVEDIKSPNPLAIMFLFGKKNRFPVEVTANEDCETLIISKKTLLSLFQDNKQLLQNFLDISSDYATRLSSKLTFLSFKTIRQKLAGYLLDLSMGESMFDLDRSQNDLAEYFGVTRPSLSRELAKMQQDGLIEISRKKVTLIDKEGLLNLVVRV